MALNAEKADKDSDGNIFSLTYVKGPASATDGAIATYNGTGGKTIQNSAKTITTSAPTSSATDSTIPTSKAVWSAISANDTKVTQAAAIGTYGAYPVLLGYNTETTAVTNTVNKTSTLTYNPNSQQLSVPYITTTEVGESDAEFLRFDNNRAYLRYDDIANYYSTLELNNSYATLEIAPSQTAELPGSYVCAYTDKIRIGFQNNNGGRIDLDCADSEVGVDEGPGIRLWGDVSDTSYTGQIKIDSSYVGMTHTNTNSEIYITDDEDIGVYSHNGRIVLSSRAASTQTGYDGTIDILAGDADFNDTIAKLKYLHAPSTSNGTNLTAGSNGQVLTSNGTSVYWGTPTDTKVTQTAITATTSADYRILLSGSTNDTTETKGANKNTNLRFNTGTKVLSVGGSIDATGNLSVTGDTTLSGATSATNLTAGSLVVTGPASFAQSPTVPTPASTSNDTTVATTAFVKSITNNGVTNVTLDTATRKLQKTINGVTSDITQLAMVPGEGEGSAIGGSLTDLPIASAKNTIAFGDGSRATKQGAVAIGGHNASVVTPLGDSTTVYTTAANYYDIAMGLGSVAEGGYSVAAGFGSHTKKPYTIALGQMSYAHGRGQTVVGRANIIDDSDTYAFIVGNGTVSTSTSPYTATRSNAMTVDWSGNLNAQNSLGVADAVQMVYNTTTQALDFVFA